MSMKALLLSAYDAQSHRIWRSNLKSMFPEIHWTELVLPARYFPWRVRGNSLSWAFTQRATLTQDYAFLLCTSMTDLSALRGFVPALSRLPTAVYYHENQFAYPQNPDPQARQTNPVEPQILSLYTALCATRVVFNSAYNRDSFLAGARQLLHKLPDHVPEGLLHGIEQASVIPVPLEDGLFSPRRKPAPSEPELLEIVWNHRWEYDKGPQLLLAIVQGLIARGLRFRLHLLGQRFRSAPVVFSDLERLLQDYAAVLGITAGQTAYIEDQQDYYSVLAQADVGLSTAEHDFQGLSVLEACALGCAPLAPQRLVYPEYLPAQCLYQGTGSIAEQADSAVAVLTRWAAMKAANMPLPRPDVSRFSQRALRDEYRALIHSLLSLGAGGSP